MNQEINLGTWIFFGVILGAAIALIAVGWWQGKD